jgi:cytochrome b
MTNPRVMLQTMITLASASLGLVAALAWNEAIKATIKQVFGTSESLAGLYTYAILATVLAVVVLTLLARASARVGGDVAFQREAEG